MAINLHFKQCSLLLRNIRLRFVLSKLRSATLPKAMLILKVGIRLHDAIILYWMQLPFTRKPFSHLNFYLIVPSFLFML